MKGISTLYMHCANKIFRFTIPSMNTSLTTLPCNNCYTIAHHTITLGELLVRFSSIFKRNESEETAWLDACYHPQHLDYRWNLDCYLTNQSWIRWNNFFCKCFGNFSLFVVYFLLCTFKMFFSDAFLIQMLIHYFVHVKFSMTICIS